MDFRATFGKNYLTESELNEFAYETSQTFRLYVDKYCEHRGIAIAEGLQHELVRRVREEYQEGITSGKME